ncbi:reverse transcriptase domain-containing protein [Tanacetum coccineum]
MKKEKSTTPAEAPILMINQEEACTRNHTSKSPTFEGRETTFPPVTKGSNSSTSVVIKARIFKREVGRVHMDSGSSCEWTHNDMTGIPRTITGDGKPFNTEHKLNGYSHIKLIKQKRQILGPDRSTSACKEVEELTRAGILREAAHHTWVANPVMVNKSDRGWRMCVDFTDINKACSKDCYPLPEIDWKVESLSGFRLKEPSSTTPILEKLILALVHAARRLRRLFRKGVGRKMDTKLEKMKPSCEWKLYTDGASSFDGAGVGLMLIDPKGKEYTYALRFKFKTTNNEAEYEALLMGLRIAQEMEIINLAIFVDS